MVYRFDSHIRWLAFSDDIPKLAITALRDMLNSELCGLNVAIPAPATSTTDAGRGLRVDPRYSPMVLAKTLPERCQALRFVDRGCGRLQLAPADSAMAF